MRDVGQLSTSQNFGVGDIGGDLNQNFVWADSFNGVDSQFLGAQNFNDWLEAIGGETLPDDDLTIVGVAEQGRTLHFAVNGND